MAKRLQTCPKKDGFRMPAEYEDQQEIFMLFPYRNDNWRDGAKPAQKAFVEVAKAISAFEKVTVCVNEAQYRNCRKIMPAEVRVVEMSSDDSWMRDCGPTFVINDNGEIRGIDWDFNAWGGLYDGLYFPWDKDSEVAQKVCELENVDSYKTDGFVLEGGSIHVDGEGTLLTTEMCLLSPGRNPDMSKDEIEENLKNYLNIDKIIWLKDGIDPEETNGHIDDVACFIAPGEVACIYSEDEDDPFYEVSRNCYETLVHATDAKGRKLRVHKLCMPKKPVTIGEDFQIDEIEGTLPRQEGDICIASYMNFLIVNGGVIVPQYGDENDERALREIGDMFPDRKVVGVYTREIVYGGGNIHCITQQMPKA